ncbi:MAG: LPXTG cell wall anchor domain-containing protein [Bacteroidota bacterium]
MKNKLLALCIFLGLFGNELSAQVTVAAELSGSQIMIGDQVELRLDIQADNGLIISEVDISPLMDVKEIEVINPGKLDTVKLQDPMRLQQRIILTSFDSGYYLVPPLFVNYTIGGQVRRAQTNQLGLAVNPFPLQGEGIEIAPIKPIFEERLSLEDVWLYFLIGILLIGGGIAFYLWRKRKEEEPAVQWVRKKAPHELAMERLKTLEEAKLWQKGEVKAYHSQLTYALREYLENRFSLNALEATTYEIMREFKKLEVEKSWHDQIQQLLQTADMVKFAKAEPPVETHAKAFELATQFVKDTKIEVEEEEREMVESSGKETN